MLAWLGLEAFLGVFLTGFPWLRLGYTQEASALAGYAPLLGVLGVSLVTAAFGVGLAQLLIMLFGAGPGARLKLWRCLGLGPGSGWAARRRSAYPSPSPRGQRSPWLWCRAPCPSRSNGIQRLEARSLRVMNASPPPSWCRRAVLARGRPAGLCDPGA